MLRPSYIKSAILAGNEIKNENENENEKCKKFNDQNKKKNTERGQ